MMKGSEVSMERLLRALLCWASALFAVDSTCVANERRTNGPIGPDSFGH